MFLLILIYCHKCCFSFCTLHSTMFLLILTEVMQYYTAVMRFTFHYVSIKTNYFMRYGWHALSFTFHYVSINTPCEMGHNLPGYRTLHSTMFLLIQIPDRDPDLTASPLHSTMFLLIRLGRSHIPNSFVSFTFHYVSINTRKCASDLS